MSSKEQERIIQELRSKSVRIEFTEIPKRVPKIDKKLLWEKAKLAGKTISDDTLSTPHPAGA